MSATRGRWPVIAVGLAVLFAAVAAILLHLLPHPLSATDYLVIGSVATLVVLLALFVILLIMWLASGRSFFRRRGD